jgi:hypothetical protein
MDTAQQNRQYGREGVTLSRHHTASPSLAEELQTDRISVAAISFPLELQSKRSID